MPAFLYFLPNQSMPPTKEDLAQRGLAYAFSRLPAVNPVSNVFGQNGAIAFDPERIDAGRAAYRADQQDWLPIPGSDCHVGVERAARPTPGDLQRVTMLPGRTVELGDELLWQAPIARSWSESGWSEELPQCVSILPDGRWQSGDTVPKYRALWQIASDYIAFIMGVATPEEEGRIRTHGLFTAATIALQANYLVGPCECSLLQLWNHRTAQNVLDAMVQRDQLIELLQKKTKQLGSAVLNSSASSAGPEASTEPTPPPI